MAQTIAFLAGIDISKDKLDVAIHKRDIAFTAANTQDGWLELGERLRQLGVGRAALEATANYGRGVMRHLQQIGITTLLLQPKQVKAFAAMTLRRAKTDRLDARLIADCAVALEQRAREPVQARFDALAEHLTYIEQVEDDIIRQKTRLEHLADTRIRRRIERDIAALSRRAAAERLLLQTAVRRHADLAARLDLAMTIPAIGPRTALTLIVRMPELGTLSREAAASLAGVAPFLHTSGRWKGETHIGGGRAQVRKALFMAAMAGAYRWNPALKAVRIRLLGRGKPALSVIVACARKLLIYSNAVLARQTPWQDSPPAAA
jgi:transposase